MHVFDSVLTIWAGHTEALTNDKQEVASVNSALGVGCVPDSGFAYILHCIGELRPARSERDDPSLI